MNNCTVILHLSLIPGIGPVTIRCIIEKFADQDMVDLYTYQVTDLVDLGLSYDRAIKIFAGLHDKSLLDKELALIEKYQIQWIAFGFSGYPQLLAAIEQPPAIIYYQGANLFASEKMIAFVGSRKADAYGKVTVEKLIPPLIQNGWAIVSGGACGIDSFVHEQVASLTGKTIVVLGSGLLHWYPVANIGLFHKVIQSGGMIISCFPLSTQPIPANFPARNRIIAGLSLGTVVVQAARKSGALITADFALEQGRQVFAVPGSIEYGLHDGCHYLIQQGAKLVTCSSDITEEFVQHADQSIMMQHEQIALPFISQDHQDVSSQDKIILDQLLTAQSVDYLLNSLPFSLDDLMQRLFDLSLQGKLEQDMMGLWKRI